MKELTIEEKATRYDEAIERAKDLYDFYSGNPAQAQKIIDIFPELKESEDEKIKKWIRKELESKYVVDNIVNNVMADKALAWLEKQSKASKVEEAMREVEEKATAFTEAYKGEISEEILAQMRGEQNPVWSEEDELIVSSIITDIEYAKRTHSNISSLYYDREIAWLKALRPQPHWKPSDEQMKQLGWIAEQNRDNALGKELMTLYQDLKKLREE